MRRREFKRAVVLQRCHPRAPVKTQGAALLLGSSMTAAAHTRSSSKT
jgi:hypothetical protein